MNCGCTWQRLLAVLATGVVFSGVVAVLLLAAPPITTAAAAEAHHEWPLFGGTPQRNMVNLVEKNILTDWAVKDEKKKIEAKNIKWVADLGSKAYGGPVIADGKIFIGTNNDRPRNPRDTDPDTKLAIDKSIIMCFEEATGKFLWQSVHDKLPAGMVHDWPREGICSSPVVEGKRLWYVSNRCEVVCATTEGLTNGKNEGPFKDEKYKDKTDADIIWKLDMIGDLGVFPHNLATCSPLIVGDTLFVITSNGVDEFHIKIPKPQAPSFLAIDKNTGKVKWSNNLPTKNLLEPGADLKHLVDRGLVMMHGQWSNPVYAEVDGKGEIIFPGGDGWIYAFEPEKGELIWKFDANPKNAIYKLGGKGTRNDFVASPVVHKNKLYIGVGQDPEHDRGVGHFWCIDIEKATKLKGDVSPELVAGDDGKAQKGKPNPNSAVAWHYGGLIDPVPEEGREYYFGRTMSTASVHDGLCFIAEQEGTLHCLDAETGKEYWQHDMQAATWSSPAFVDGKIYMGNDKNKLLIFKHDKTKNKIAEIDMKGMVRATPVACNGVLYVMTENKLYAIAAGK
jgi:outer membrane protein assembly factor BamB